MVAAGSRSRMVVSHVMVVVGAKGKSGMVVGSVADPNLGSIVIFHISIVIFHLSIVIFHITIVIFHLSFVIFI